MQMLFRLLPVLLVIVSCSKSHGRKSNYINSTGTYKYSRSDSTGPSGVIQVNAIEKNKIVLNLYVTNGAPSYNSGSAFDTLAYEDHKAVYRTPEMTRAVASRLHSLKGA